MLEFIVISILFLIIGYFFGYTANVKTIERVTREIRSKATVNQVGIINEPTAQDLKKRGTKEAKEEDAMNELLEQLDQKKVPND